MPRKQKNILRRAWDRVVGGLKAAGSENITAYSTLSAWDNVDPPDPFTYGQALKQGFFSNELVYAIITDMAESAAEPTLRVYRGEDEIADHPARDLFVAPNPEMSEFESNELKVLDLMLAGNSFWQKIRSRAGRVVELWRISPGRMMPVPDPSNGRLLGWLYYPEQGQPIPLGKTDLIHYKMPNPATPYLGLAPIAVATRAVYRDNQATDFINAFFENSAVPQGLLKLKHQAEEGEADRVRATWRARYAGKAGWYDVAVLDADTEYQQLGLSQEEMGWPDLTDLSETRIAMIFKWPPVLIGSLVGLKHATYSNIETARKIAWEDTLSPLYNRLSIQTNFGLARDFGFKIRDLPFRWDFSKVQALKPDENEQRDHARADWESGLITRNEARAISGFEALGGGDVLRISMNAIEYPATERPPVVLDSNDEVIETAALPIESIPEIYTIMQKMARRLPADSNGR